MKIKALSLCRLFGGFLFLLFLSACGHDESANQSSQSKDYPRSLKAVVVKETGIPIYYEAVGTVKAKTSTTLSSQVPGRIKQINVNEGQAFVSGDLLVLIDDRDVEERLKQAQAGLKGAERSLNEINAATKQAMAQKEQARSALALSQSEYKRYQKLVKEEVISQQKFEQATSQLEITKAQLEAAEGSIAALTSKKEQARASIEVARARVEEARIMKSHTRILAPFDGVIIKKHVDVGSLAVPGLPLLSIERPHGFRLEVDVREEEFAGNVEIGRQVATQIDALGGKIIYGYVAEIVPSANALSRTFRVKIALPETQDLKSGMYGKALCTRGIRQGILIPATGVVKHGQLEQVFTVDKDRIAHLRLVKTGKRIEDRIEILAGLVTGDQLLIHPPGDLSDLSRVNVEVLR